MNTRNGMESLGTPHFLILENHKSMKMRITARRILDMINTGSNPEPKEQLLTFYQNSTFFLFNFRVLYIGRRDTC